MSYNNLYNVNETNYYLSLRSFDIIRTNNNIFMFNGLNNFCNFNKFLLVLTNCSVTVNVYVTVDSYSKIYIYEFRAFLSLTIELNIFEPLKNLMTPESLKRSKIVIPFTCAYFFFPPFSVI